MNPAELIAILLAILSGCGALFVAVATSLTAARKADLERLRLIIESQKQEIDRLSNKVLSLEAENQNLRVRVKTLEDENKTLRRQLRR